MAWLAHGCGKKCIGSDAMPQEAKPRRSPESAEGEKTMYHKPLMMQAEP